MNHAARIAFFGSALLGVPCIVVAQDTPQGATIDEVVVTARRKEESLQDVPQTVSAVTAATVEKLNILQFEDIQAVVPGLTLSASGVLSRASLRGVSFLPETRTSSTVEFYMNDALVESNFLFKSLFDVGQIEVLRGPQGTLRGRAAPSGSITVATRTADLAEFGGYVSATGTMLDSTNVQGAINLPLIEDKLAIRIAGLLDNNDLEGVKSVHSGIDPEQDTKAARVNVRFQPIDALDVSLTYQHLEEDLTYFDAVTGAGAAAHPLHPAGYNGPVLQSSDRRSISDEPNFVSQKQPLATANVNWDFAGQTLSYVGSYSKKETEDRINGDDGNLLPGGEIFSLRPNTWVQRTHELRLSSEERIAGFIDYTAGVFYSKSTIDTFLRQPANFLPGAFGSPLTPPANPNAFNSRYQLDTAIDLNQANEEKSAFASVTFHVTDRTELTLGGRYIDLKATSAYNLQLQPAFASVPLIAIAPAPSCAAAGLTSTYAGTCDLPSSRLPLPPLPPIPATEDNFQPFVYNAAASHRFTDDVMAYVNVGSSWRPGVDVSSEVNNVGNNAQLSELSHIKEEKSRSYETGLKWSFLDRRAVLNVAVFHQTFDNMIIRTRPVPYVSNNGVSAPSVVTRAFTANANAIVDGIDLDASFQLTPQWNVSAAFSYADGRVDDDEVPCRDSNFDGIADENPVSVASFPAGSVIAVCKSDESVSQNPQWNATLQSEYSLSIARGFEPYVRGLYTYYPENDRQDRGFTVDNYGLLNLYLGLRDQDGVWDVSFFAKNALKTSETLSRGFDEVQSPGSVQAIFGTSGYYSTSYSPRREIGLTVRYAFGSR
jgi:iron complex outermembrane receptor protein